MPAMANQSVVEARQALRAERLMVDVVLEESDKPGGSVIRSAPEAGEKVGKNDTITLYVSGMVTLPALKDEPLDKARTMLKKVRLPATEQTYSDDLIVIKYEPSEQGEEVVLRTIPAAGKQVLIGSDVVLTVSEDKVAVPDVSGEQERNALDSIVAARLKYEIVRDWKPKYVTGTVFKTEPAAASKLSRNGLVRIYVASEGG